MRLKKLCLSNNMDNETEQSLLDLVKQNYDEIAEDFNQTRQKVIWPELVRLAEMVQRGDSVLDAGCGNGRLLQVFRLKPVRYVGVDNNYKFIEFARSSWAVPNGRFVYGDILDLDGNPAITEKFDYIFCVAVIHNLPGMNIRIKAIRQMVKKLKPGGKIILTAWQFWNKPEHLLQLAKYTCLKMAGKHRMDWGDFMFEWAKSGSKRYYHAFTLGELIECAVRAGIEIEKAYKDNYNYYLIGKQAKTGNEHPHI